jgi:hypothetical protein
MLKKYPLQQEILFMMSALNKKRSHAGQYIVELAVVIACTGMVMAALGPLIDSVFQFYSRQKINQLYSLHIDPLQRLISTQVPQCRYRVYVDKGAAEGAPPGDYNIMANVKERGNALRCDRLDKSGNYFILSYSPGNKTLTVEGFAAGGGSKLFTLSRSLSLPSGKGELFDISEGFLQVWCALQLPKYHNMNVFFQVEDTTNRLVEYVLVGERQQ